MVDLQALAHRLRCVVLADDQLAAAGVTDAILFGRIGDDVIAGAALGADTPPVSGLKLSKSSGSAVKKELSEDKPKEIVRKINEKTLDQIYAGERGLIICPFCETFNSQKNTRCCACGQPIRK